jgi:flavin-dependent dehydrogenase
LLQAKVLLPEGLDSSTCQVWFNLNKTKYFYWLIPESQETAAIGLIADDDQQARACLEAILKERKLEPLEFQEVLVPLHRFGYINGGQVLGRNIFFVGDAAAQVKVTTVGGVVTGLHGARALANELLNGRNYRKELRGLKLELNLHLFIREVLNRFRDEDYDELIVMLKGRLKGVLEKWPRDELRTCFLKLILTEPRLILLGIKALMNTQGP